MASAEAAVGSSKEKQAFKVPEAEAIPFYPPPLSFLKKQSSVIPKNLAEVKERQLELLPRVGEIVWTEVLRSAEAGEVVTLLEYGGIEAMLPHTEIARGRIRGVSKVIKVGHRYALEVLRVEVRQEGGGHGAVTSTTATTTLTAAATEGGSGGAAGRPTGNIVTYIDVGKKNVTPSVGESKRLQFERAKAVQHLLLALGARFVSRMVGGSSSSSPSSSSSSSSSVSDDDPALAAAVSVAAAAAHTTAMLPSSATGITTEDAATIMTTPPPYNLVKAIAWPLYRQFLSVDSAAADSLTTSGDNATAAGGGGGGSTTKDSGRAIDNTGVLISSAYSGFRRIEQLASATTTSTTNNSTTTNSTTSTTGETTATSSSSAVGIIKSLVAAAIAGGLILPPPADSAAAAEGGGGGGDDPLVTALLQTIVSAVHDKVKRLSLLVKAECFTGDGVEVLQKAFGLVREGGAAASSGAEPIVVSIVATPMYSLSLYSDAYERGKQQLRAAAASIQEYLKAHEGQLSVEEEVE